MGIRQLEQFVMEEWNRVFQATCRNYVLSMRRRFRALKLANGGQTKNSVLDNAEKT
jgi:hypothetical protein